MTIDNIITLSDLLSEMGRIKRATKLTNHESESDSHHSFSLALIAYQVVSLSCPELDVNKVVIFALCHDLLEIVTGDENTLHYTPKQHEAKQNKEKEAMAEFDDLFKHFPALKSALHEYEKLDSPEAATIFVLDKASTTWTHHSHAAKYAREMNIRNKSDVREWAIRLRSKFSDRLAVSPPQKIFDIFEESFKSLEEHYND